MACINMFNPDHQGLYGGGAAPPPPPMSPRISFSNDFVVDSSTGCPSVKYERSAASSSSDFEFSVGSYSMMAADELFSKGRLKPLKEHCVTTQMMQRMTLRDELLAGDDEDVTFSYSSSSSSSRSIKGPIRWKSLLGLRKAHSSVGKKHDKGDGSSDRAAVVSQQQHQVEVEVEEEVEEDKEEEEVSRNDKASSQQEEWSDEGERLRDLEVGS